VEREGTRPVKIALAGDAAIMPAALSTYQSLQRASATFWLKDSFRRIRNVNAFRLESHHKVEDIPSQACRAMFHSVVARRVPVVNRNMGR
jgi:uncharacterized sodium:solute symporter family permease YidK